jgi:hypothetical protein
LRLKRLEREGKIEPRPDRYEPHLVACSAPGKPVFVFPGSDGLCRRLGLEPLPGDYAAAGRQAARAYTAWDRVLMKSMRVEPGECRSPSGLAAQARSRLVDAGYADIRVVIDRGGPCAERVESHGRVIEVFTVSRLEDRRASVELQVGEVAEPLFEKATLTCNAPSRFRSLLRGALDRAGFEKVGVRGERTDDPCLGGGIGSGPNVVSFAGMARRQWQENKNGFERYLRGKARREGSRAP